MIDRTERKVLISFDYTAVAQKHLIWLKSVEKRVGLGELNPQPYWGFDDLFHKAGSKLHNCFYIKADYKKENGIEFFSYNKIMKLSNLSFEKFLGAIEDNKILVDFDARTGHNHGTKFRMRQNALPDLYENVEEI